ncbi:MAG: EAL domain-containing protein [Sulfurimonadaceae bacterium]|nr:EAL domain-containing protein [Sulfurimonadaceae bacterium]
MGSVASLEVLYVEHEFQSYETVLSVLEDLNHNVIHATNIPQALESFRLRQPDLILCNLHMPDMDAFEMLRQFKVANSNMHIVAVDQLDKPECMLDAVNLGVSGFLAKPVDTEKLREMMVTVLDKVNQERKAENAQHMIDEYLKVFDTSVIFSKTDPHGIITYANDAFAQTSGYSKEELIGQPHNIIRHPDTPAEVFEELWRTIKSGQIWKGVIKNRNKAGEGYTVESTIIPILDTEGKIIEFMALRYDITEMTTHSMKLQDVASKNEMIALQRSRELIERLYIDNNSDLPNNLALQRDIEELNDGTLFMLDINNFNIFNKLHGFAFGDKLLKTIAQNLSFLLDRSETLYKMGADRYAILTERSDGDYIDYLCNQIFAYFDNSEIVIDTIENQITFSIGVAKVQHDRDAIIDAEFALDVSKRYGKRFKIVYNKDSEEFQQEHDSISWLNRTREFIYKDMITPYYQPIVDVSTREVFKYEALARVIDGDTVIPPDRFLNAASRLGLLTSITKSMINKSFAQFSGTDTRFSINITERDIMDGYLAEFIKLKVEKYDIDPSNVTFEVLENLTLSNEGEVVKSTIALVKDYGCNIAIDDFGSENSNFGRILSLQSDYLKIDGMFVEDCDVEPEKQKIIDAIVQLAKRLEIKTIAEYVTTESVYETIKSLGVDYAQGYLFGKPAPME